MKEFTTRYRWRICGLLFFATTINYVDRNVLSFILLNDDFIRDMLGLARDTVLSDEHRAAFKKLIGTVDAVFKGAYALGFVLMGLLIDKLGTRIGYAISILLWGVSAIAHSLVGSVAGLRFARIGLGIGEAGNFPAANKTVAEWFPKRERSTAVGFFNAGANLGIISTAFAVPYLTSHYGWRVTFILTSSLAFVLLILWLISYRKPENHPKVSIAELELINSDKEEFTNHKISWFKLFPYRQTWAFAAAKFMTDCIWWFYLFWLPSFFAENANFKLNLKPNFSSWEDILTMGMPFLVIYLVSDLGSIIFGRVSSFFIQKGWSVNKARKTTMLICALCVLPIFMASQTSNIFIAIALISLAAAAHQGWSANLFTTVSDMFPKNAVASVTGIGGMFGAIGGMLFSYYSGIIIGSDKNYLPLFAIASIAYVVALAIFHLLIREIKSVTIR